MATQFARATVSSPAPFLLARSAGGLADASFAGALRAAVAAEAATAGARRPCQRIARVLCELGKTYGCRRHFPVSRPELATTLGISLIRVKRTLALLSLSGVVSCESDRISVLDWRKLSGVARFDPEALGLGADEEELPCAVDEEPRFLTAGGDPACFV